MRLTEIIERLAEIAERRGGDCRVIVKEYDTKDEIEIEGVRVNTSTGEIVVEIIAS